MSADACRRSSAPRPHLLAIDIISYTIYTSDGAIAQGFRHGQGEERRARGPATAVAIGVVARRNQDAPVHWQGPERGRLPPRTTPGRRNARNATGRTASVGGTALRSAPGPRRRTQLADHVPGGPGRHFGPRSLFEEDAQDSRRDHRPLQEALATLR